MQWIWHQFRTLWRRSPMVTVAATSIAAIAAGLVAFGVAGQLGGGDAVAAADPTATEFVDARLAELGVSSDEFVDDVVDALFPNLPASVDRAEVTVRLATALGLDDPSPSAVAEAFVRRLGIDAVDAPSASELVGALAAEIDPDGDISTVDEMIAAVEAWGASSSPHVLRVTSSAGSATDLSELPFARAAALLAEPHSQVVDVEIGTIDGFDALVGAGVRVYVDRADRSIALVGDTRDVSSMTDAELFVVLHWAATDDPEIVAGLAADRWRLANAGYSGRIGDISLPDVTFAMSDRAVEWPADVADVDGWSMAADVPTVAMGPGITVFGSVDASALPSVVTSVLGRSLRTADAHVQGSLGSSFGPIDGSTMPSTVELQVAIDGLGPPDLPTWMATSAVVPWVLTLAHERGGDVEVALGGGLDVQLGGGVQRFDARLVGTSGGSSSARLDATMTEPWRAAFGQSWLDLTDVTLAADLGGDEAASVQLAATTSVGGRSAAVSADLDAGGAAVLLVELEQLSAADAIRLVSASSGLTPPADVPDLVIDDVAIEVAVGGATTVAVGGIVTVADQRVHAVVGVESADGESGLMFAVGLDAWSLADVVPATAGTVLDVLEFPPSVLVYSTLDGTIDPASLSTPAQRLFARADAGGPLTVVPGLSVLGSLDLSGTALERPLHALGFDADRFPLVGTIPGSAIGMGGGTTGGTVTSELALAVQLPEIAPGDAPEWFRRGSLSIVASGQPSLGLQGRMTAMIDGEELEFVVGAEFAKTPLGTELALFGELETDRPWESPFGIEWLVVNGLTVEASVDPTGVVGLGFAGDIVIGDKDLQAALAVDLSPAGVPTNIVVFAASAEGVSTTDLFAVQREMAGAAGVDANIDTSEYPELLLRDVELRFAPQASPRLGVDAGFVVAGQAYAAVGGGEPGRFAALDVRLTEAGLFASGSLAEFELGPLEWSDVVLDLEFSGDRQYFLLDGRVELLGISAAVDLDLSTESIVFAGREALAELERAVALFEAAMADPSTAIGNIPQIFADAGVELPPWAAELFGLIADVAERREVVSAGAIDTILNGGSIRLSAAPAGGAAERCPVTAPQFEGGRCYTTLPVVSPDGVPAGGTAPACVFPNLSKSGGRCYTTPPRTVQVCPSGSVTLVSDTSKCRRTSYPYGTVKKVDKRLPGVPDGGRAPACGLPTTSSGGRCYLVPPGELLPAVPADGVDLVCGVETPIPEDGRCWRVTPSAAERGLGVEGICVKYANVSCSLDDLVRRDLLVVFVEGLVDRLDDW